MSIITPDKEYQETLEKVAEKIKDAEYILIGGAAGMSSASGINSYDINDPIYLENFKDIEAKYHAGSIWRLYYLKEYTGQDWESREDYWGFITTLMHFDLHERIYQPYIDLKEILANKNYDIVTTNQDVQFPRAFPEKDVAVIQGDWRYLQCSRRCHDKVYPSVELCDKLFSHVKDGKLPSDLIPRCPKCNAEMHEWVRGPRFLQGSFYDEQYEKYRNFMDKAKKTKSVLLELGVGMMTPMFIKEPFMSIADDNHNCTYIPINPKHAIIPKVIEGNSIAVRYDLARFLNDLKKLI